MHRKQGFVRIRINGILYDLDEVPKLQKTKKHNIDVVVDRFSLKENIRSRLTDSVEISLKQANGLVCVLIEENGEWKEQIFSEVNACISCGISFDLLEARHFSFNSPYGACPVCQGLGTQLVFDVDSIIPDQSLPWIKSIHPFRYGGRRVVIYYKKLLYALSETYEIDPEIPFNQLSEDFKDVLLNGSKNTEIHYYMRRRLVSKPFDGVLNLLNKRLDDNESEGKSHWLRG